MSTWQAEDATRNGYAAQRPLGPRLPARRRRVPAARRSRRGAGDAGGAPPPLLPRAHHGDRDDGGREPHEGVRARRRPPAAGRARHRARRPSPSWPTHPIPPRSRRSARAATRSAARPAPASRTSTPRFDETLTLEGAPPHAGEVDSDRMTTASATLERTETDQPTRPASSPGSPSSPRSCSCVLLRGGAFVIGIGLLFLRLRPAGEALRVPSAEGVPHGPRHRPHPLHRQQRVRDDRRDRARRRRRDPLLLDPELQPAGLPAHGVSIALAVVLVFVGNYWGHRFTHTVPLLWRFHSVHHSIEQMDWVAAGRLHPFDSAFTQAFTIMPLFVLGYGGGVFAGRRGVHHVARDLPARERAPALPGAAVDRPHARVAPLAPRDRRRSPRQELRPARRRQDLRHRAHAEGQAPHRLRHPLPRPPRGLPQAPRLPLHEAGRRAHHPELASTSAV